MVTLRRICNKDYLLQSIPFRKVEKLYQKVALLYVLYPLETAHVGSGNK